MENHDHLSVERIVNENKDSLFFELFQAAGKNSIKGLMIGQPGKVISYDDKLQRAVVECGIQKSLGNGEYETPSLIRHVPVQFSGSPNFSFFHELPAGTEGYINFSQRAIDTWLDQGGPVAPLDARMFSASDAFFAPGYRSAITCISGLPIVGIGMSNRDGSIRFHLTDDGIEFVVGASKLSITPNGMTFDGMQFTNNGKTILNDRTEITKGGLAVATVEFDDHTHGGVQRGEGNTNGPNK